MKTATSFRSRVLPLAIAILPALMQADTINGTTAGTTVAGVGPDDLNTASTVNITYQTFCPWIVNGVTAYPGSNFVFAGFGVASGFKDVSASDFTISDYTPWVVNNNATTNNITDPAGVNRNRGVTNQDAGGADIVISYTPKNKNDPTDINFVQAFIQNTNNAGFTKGKIDSGPGSPYYNSGAVSGTGTTGRTGTIPLVTTSTTPAWLVDIPYRCESFSPTGNPFGNGAKSDCSGGVDDSLLSQVQYFQTFLEANEQIDGKTYQVLFGGVQWGYSYSNVDVPEPSVVLLTGSGLLGLGILRRRRRRS
jgi:hypothetical protein